MLVGGIFRSICRAQVYLKAFALKGSVISVHRSSRGIFHRPSRGIRFLRAPTYGCVFKRIAQAYFLHFPPTWFLPRDFTMGHTPNGSGLRPGFDLLRHLHVSAASFRLPHPRVCLPSSIHPRSLTIKALLTWRYRRVARRVLISSVTMDSHFIANRITRIAFLRFGPFGLVW